MSTYILLYITAVLLSVYLGYIVYQHYREKSGLFFFLCTVFAALWCLSYFLMLSGLINNDTIILYISRFSFFSSTAGMYSFLFFIIFFQDKERVIYKNLKIILTLFVGLFLLTLFSDFIVESVKLEKNIYRENYGILYFIYVILYLLFLPIAIYFSDKQIKKQSNLNKLRLKKILYGSLTFVGVGVLFQVILPLFGIWIFEKELIFFFVFFILSVVYVIQRYFFLDIGYGVGKFVISAISLLLSTLILYLINSYYSKLNNSLISSWYINSGYSPIDNIIGVIVFFLIYKILSIIFLGNILKTELKDSIEKLEQKISYITNFKKLNLILSQEINNIFKTNFCEIILFKNSSEKNELQKYFETVKYGKVFINDLVFIEENESFFDKEKIINSYPKKSFLIFPIYNSEKENIGIFTLGTKFFGDFYNIDEINILERLVFFLEYHLKYIENYEQLTDLNINLDKKVDEKTIEYNNLINKQKEFISMISHELRSPISSAVFQADSIIDDLDLGNFDKEKIKSELEILNSLLIKTGDLSSKLFSVQYYDTHSITLYKEKVQISNLLKNELEIYSHINENIKFIDKVDKNIGFVEIDKIQFQQVIENILSNAIKFIQKNGTIKVEAYKKNGYLTINIEDDGKGFEGIETTQLFEKYSTGNGNYVGLGMGLYLCKKIIDMHKGEIIAESSKELGGAKFIIKIPIQ